VGQMMEEENFGWLGHSLICHKNSIETLFIYFGARVDIASIHSTVKTRIIYSKSPPLEMKRILKEVKGAMLFMDSSSSLSLKINI